MARRVGARLALRPGTVSAVTGAASGIGRALALALARDGVSLSLADVDREGLEGVVEEVRAAGGTADGHVVDVTRPAQVEAWAAATGERADVTAVWAVAGIINAGTVLDASTADVAAVVDVDFWGIVHTVRAFLPAVVAARGAVVTVSSAFGLISAPGYGAYNASKFAVRGWTDALRQEMRAGGTGVTVSCVYPGAVRTPIMARATSAAGADDARRRREVFETRLARTSPERAAEVILAGVRKGSPRVLVGADARVADLLARLTGTGYERLAGLLSGPSGARRSSSR